MKTYQSLIKVYIAGNYSATSTIKALQNIGKGQRVCADLFRVGFAVFCPWFDKEFVTLNPDHDFDVKQFHDASMAWLESSDVIYVISGKGKGGGVDAEIKRAEELDIPVFYKLSDLMLWSNSVID